MDVLVDSNILFGSPKMSSPSWAALKTYLKTTRSRLLIPAVVKDEMLANFRKRLESHLKELNSACRDLFELSGTKLITDIQKDFVAESCVDYEKWWNQEVANKRIELLPYSEQTRFQELAHRAITRLPPFDQKGSGFRDCLLWFSLTDWLKTAKVDRIALISNDHAAYIDDKSKTLHPTLVADLVNGCKIFPFLGLQNFLQDIATKIDFIDKAFVERVAERFKDEIKDCLLDSARYLSHYEFNSICRDYDIDYEGGGRIERVHSMKTKSHFVNELDDGHYLVSVEMYAELDIEVEALEEDEDSVFGDLEWHPMRTLSTTAFTHGVNFTIELNVASPNDIDLVEVGSIV